MWSTLLVVLVYWPKGHSQEGCHVLLFIELGVRRDKRWRDEPAIPSSAQC